MGCFITMGVPAAKICRQAAPQSHCQAPVLRQEVAECHLAQRPRWSSHLQRHRAWAVGPWLGNKIASWFKHLSFSTGLATQLYWMGLEPVVSWRRVLVWQDVSSSAYCLLQTSADKPLHNLIPKRRRSVRRLLNVTWRSNHGGHPISSAIVPGQQGHG